VADYTVRLLDQAADDLARLDAIIARRILKRLDWLQANIETIVPGRLTGQFAGLNKLRVGDYRVIYQVIQEELVIVVRAIGHRRDVYGP
jgi:mRNA interferase RelE/StbE